MTSCSSDETGLSVEGDSIAKVMAIEDTIGVTVDLANPVAEVSCSSAMMTNEIVA